MGILKAVLTVLFKLLLTVALALGAIAAWFYYQSTLVAESKDDPLVVNDITTLNPVRVGKVVRPQSEQDIIDAILATDGPISIGGGRYSMGGQSAYPASLHFDMRSFNRILELDPEHKRIRVESGATWRDIQQYIDPYNLSVRVMQDFNNFTVGGSLSVNAHGRFNEEGPIIGSVRSLRIVLADGKVYEASRETNSALFYAAIGGYGGIGVITEVELDLTDNIKLEREVKRLQFYEFPSEFLSQVLDNDQVVLHQGILYPPNYEVILDVLWKKTDKPLTIPDRLQKPVERKWWSRPLVDWLSTSDLLKLLRRLVVDPWIYDEPEVVWRNYETSADLMSKGFATSINKTLAMREYFIPVDKFEIFVLKMRDIFMQIDSSYLLSVAAVQGGEALASRLTNAEQQTALRLGNSVGNYAQSAALVAKYYSLDVELDENGNVATIGRERALADMLDLADQRAREAINMNGDDVPVMAVLAYETARLKRQGSPGDQIEALQNYWAATTLAHVQAYLNGLIGE